MTDRCDWLTRLIREYEAGTIASMELVNSAFRELIVQPQLEDQALLVLRSHSDAQLNECATHIANLLVASRSMLKIKSSGSPSANPNSEN